MSDFGPDVRCKRCGTNDPLSDKLGWLEMRHEHVPEPMGVFCGGPCASLWMREAFDRLVDRVMGR
jgi:hypothetical protein